MPNAAKLERLKLELRELAKTDQFNMGNWVVGQVLNPHADTATACGTQFCAAGAHAILMGYSPEIEFQDRWDHEQGKYVQGEPIATGSFVRRADVTAMMEGRHVPTFEAEILAEEDLDLDDYESTFLFHCTHVVDVEHICRRIDWLVEGRNPDLFPENWQDEEHAANEAREESLAG